MIEPGQYNELEISRTVSFGIFLTDGEQEVLLPEKYAPKIVKIGEMLRVFIYFDSEDRIIATTREPLGVVGQTVSLKAVDVNNYGAFMDWGLEKDLLVPFKEQHERMEAGKEYAVKIIFDHVSGRIIGSSEFNHFLKSVNDNTLTFKEQVSLQVLRELEIGYIVAINDSFQGMLYKSELYGRKLVLGEKLDGYVSNLRDDNKIDLSLRQPGFDGVQNLKPAIIAELQNNNGFLPLNSKSSPEEIQKRFNISKKAFKQVIGNLYKEKKIIITDQGIELVNENKL